ncbi:MAG: D-alanyl-D-alanine carboxypeptidase/D-alanyl-D-alanine-endopeptidase [Nannocystaceae bacterium]
MTVPVWSRAAPLLIALGIACAPATEPDRVKVERPRHEASALAEGPPTTGHHREGDLLLARGFDDLLAAKFLQNAQVGLSVIELPSRRVVYEHNGDTPLNPASNVKLVTSAAALSLLGPQHRYQTRVYAARDSVSDGVVKGDLFLKGEGDPHLVTAHLYAIARKLRGAGIRRVTGGIVVDSTRFDHDGLPPGFDQKNEFASYRAPTGATSVNFNTFVLQVQPAPTVDDSPLTQIFPPVTRVRVNNQATTAPGKRNRISVAAAEKSGTLTLTLTGKLGVRARTARYRYPVADPSVYAGAVFRLTLGDAGIRVARKRIRSGTVPRGSVPLATHNSDPLGEYLRSINKLSNNFMAEQLLRTLAPGEGATAQAALDQIRTYLTSIGMSGEGLHIGNGSGLYDNNRITTHQMTYLLATMAADFRYAAEFMSSLSTMGIDGTAKSRLRGTTAAGWVRSKTGTLEGVSALSGYVGAPTARRFAFSFLLNDLGKRDTRRARALQDRVVELLAEAAASQPPP